jgi:multiple sugar transport system permease protein
VSVRTRPTSRLGLFVLPSLIGLFVSFLIPLIVVAWLTTQSWDLISAPEFVGWENFLAAASDPAIRNSLRATAILVAVTVPVEIVLALAVALLLKPRRPGGTIFRAVLVLPWVAAPLATGIMWRWIFAPTDGLLSTISGRRIEWIVDPVGAVLIVAFVMVWGSVGYLSLFFLAGLLAIPDSLHDAAALDGAGRWQRLVYVSLPMLRPSIIFVVVIATAQTLTTFDQVFALTGGGAGTSTDVLALRMYSAAFETFDLGTAAVIAVGMLIALTVITALTLRLRRSADA